MNAKTNHIGRRIVDVCMTVLLLCLMAYQVTGEALHEWIGMAMTLLVIVHQILNWKWYGALFKGKYHALRIIMTAVNLLLLAAMLLTALCGMSMSGYAVPFLYGMAPVSFVRSMHLSMSHWTFILMGLHLGIHIPMMTARWKWSDKTKHVIRIVAAAVAGLGLYLILKNNLANYLFFRVPFAFLDYEKAGVFVFLENLLMLLFPALIGAEAVELCRMAGKKEKEKALLPVCLMMGANLIGLVLWTALPGDRSDNSFSSGGWNVRQDDAETDHSVETSQENPNTQEADTGESSFTDTPVELNDGFILIQGGSFLMGSPDSENWRIDDETQHSVTISSFFIDPFETTQAEYERLMGENPSEFRGSDLPVESITWLDAIRFANAKSEDSGLTPVYSITEEGVTWDRSANGYRLPTEAEWEYACRAGTDTPFNCGHTLGAENANFYGHYPYEIEENYFDNSSLEAKPGIYRQETLAVGSFYRNAWGLYDMHGNVNEWCWDYYGAYDIDSVEDPTGAVSGTRHIYRGGGWNDFGKNMRSAYRAAGQSDYKSYNLGVRLVRNAGMVPAGTLLAKETTDAAATSGKVLIVFFSWSGNTRGIAQEIQRQTGADLFEITLVHPYSSNYNTVLMEAQEDQHRQARPEISGHVDNFDDYDVILLGYPNWWASIPMPIASFLEEYDFTGKTIIPFCSHGGGRFGQSLTAIAKLAPDAVMGEGLSVHYSGGSTLTDDVAAWLESNGISTE